MSDKLDVHNPTPAKPITEGAAVMKTTEIIEAIKTEQPQSFAQELFFFLLW